MTKSYCVFWIPTIYHSKPVLIRSNTIEKEICDDAEEVNSSHKVKVKLKGQLESGGIFEIISEVSALPETKSIVNLEVVSLNSIGFLYCTYQLDEGESESLFIGKIIPNAIYHIIKEFFHVHEHHNGEEDSLLCAYTSTEPIVINENDNKPLIHYLKIYEKKFITYNKVITTLYSSILNKELEDENRVYKIQNESISFIYEFCNQALGESIYFNSLFYSKYNNSCRIPFCATNLNINLPTHVLNSELCPINYPRNEEGKANLYKIALNIQNSIKEIELIKSKITIITLNVNAKLTDATYRDNRHNSELIKEVKELQAKAEKSLEKGNKLAIIGVVASVLSIFLSLATAINPNGLLNFFKFFTS